MDSQYSEYISFLTKYRDELSSYLESEGEKRRSLLSGDLERLEKMLNVQQAQAMKFRTMETKRAALQSKLGLTGGKAAELLEKIGDTDDKKSIQALFSEMNDIAVSIREQNRQSLGLAESKLKIYDSINLGGDTDSPNKLYGPENNRRTAFSAGDAFEETI
ncbi:MAG: flagellar export chaperone FlgN [Oscillospiraceae bacterium]|nr:flagellar export chaperone FlgN [Oscillospiraceae bacterium]